MSKAQLAIFLFVQIPIFAFSGPGASWLIGPPKIPPQDSQVSVSTPGLFVPWIFIHCHLYLYVRTCTVWQSSIRYESLAALIETVLIMAESLFVLCNHFFSSIERRDRRAWFSSGFWTPQGGLCSPSAVYPRRGGLACGGRLSSYMC